MVNIKEMPYSERYSRVANMLKLQEKIVLPFIKEQIDNQAETDYRKMIQVVMKTVPENASFEQKYQKAFTNWFLSSNILFNFIRSKLGEEGIDRFTRLFVEELKQQNGGIIPFFAAFTRLINPVAAFSASAGKVAYQLQWLGSSSVVKTSKAEWLVDIPQCTIMNYPDNENVCLIGCHKMFTMWVAEQFKVKLQYHRQGKNCAMTITPLK